MGKGRSNKPYFRDLMSPSRKKDEPGQVQNPIRAAKAAAKAQAQQKQQGKQATSPGGKKLAHKAKQQEKATESGHQLDGEGRPYITLVQFLKIISAVETGGAGKHVVRSGVITVNNEVEIRPTRKLHHGDMVTCADTVYTVEIQ